MEIAIRGGRSPPSGGGGQNDKWDWEFIIREWLIAGYDLDLFWRSSIKTVRIAMDAADAIHRRDYNERVLLAWNAAAWARSKRMPKPDKFFMQERKPKQTWEDQFALMQQWHRAQERRKAAAAMQGV